MEIGLQISSLSKITVMTIWNIFAPCLLFYCGSATVQLAQIHQCDTSYGNLINCTFFLGFTP